jgi:hypothetical protein
MQRLFETWGEKGQEIMNHGHLIQSQKIGHFLFFKLLQKEEMEKTIKFG